MQGMGVCLEGKDGRCRYVEGKEDLLGVRSNLRSV